MDIVNMFKANSDFSLEQAREIAVKLLETTPEALDAFEKEYEKASILEGGEGTLGMNSRQAAEQVWETAEDPTQVASELTKRIVNELLCESGQKRLTEENAEPVTLDEIHQLPVDIRPQLTGNLMYKHINDEKSYLLILNFLDLYQNTGRKIYYNLFRQGLDLLDLDEVMYEMLGMNPNSIGHWFPALKRAADAQDFFKIPKTKIVKVPLPILQLTRMDYPGLTPTTLDIVNKWAYQAFELDEHKTYFVKTGTYSSKFDFRNAKVTTPKEVRELGSYLLYIQHQAVDMAGPLSTPSIYGLSTTNEWCVREYIEDKEHNPCIYHGLPLHTEYRVFIDCDEKKVLGIVPYWMPEVMKKRFEKGHDANTIDMIHDAVIYKVHEKKLMGRYEKNKDRVLAHVEKMLPDIDLTGQWSLDIMQNGDDFWLIDMAMAHQSALSEYIPEGMIHNAPENWIPRLEKEEQE